MVATRWEADMSLQNATQGEVMREVQLAIARGGGEFGKSLVTQTKRSRVGSYSRGTTPDGFSRRHDKCPRVLGGRLCHFGACRLRERASLPDSLTHSTAPRRSLQWRKASRPSAAWPSMQSVSSAWSRSSPSCRRCTPSRSTGGWPTPTSSGTTFSPTSATSRHILYATRRRRGTTRAARRHSRRIQ